MDIINNFKEWFSNLKAWKKGALLGFIAFFIYSSILLLWNFEAVFQPHGYAIFFLFTHFYLLGLPLSLILWPFIELLEFLEKIHLFPDIDIFFILFLSILLAFINFIFLGSLLGFIVNGIDKKYGVPKINITFPKIFFFLSACLIAFFGGAFSEFFLSILLILIVLLMIIFLAKHTIKR